MKEQIEKQAIEEMAKFIKESCAKTPCFQDEKPYTDCDVCAAIYLYSAGYRKQSEGEWITVGEGITERVVCSNCKSSRGSFMLPPFCNQCGAKMKGGEE